jgi:hypothetical protein
MFREGDRVRVPNPAGDGMLEAIYVAPSEPRRKRAEWVWVQYLEGREAGANGRVRCADVQNATDGRRRSGR